MPPLDVIEVTDRYTHLALAGRLDIPTVNAIQLRFTSEATVRRKPVILDLSGVELMTSYAMGMLVSAARTLLGHGASIVAYGALPHVDLALRAIALDRVIALLPDLAAAKQQIGAA